VNRSAVRDGVAEGDAVIRSSSVELDRIAREIAESRNAMALIATATREQREEAKTLTEELDGIAAAAEENAATSEQVSALVEEQTSAMAHVSQSSQHLASVAAQLKSGMARFAL
jgi:methyl-accepting chemotaxis protein